MMNRNYKRSGPANLRRRPGFTLMEVMVAILFISIAFFGYAALHERIIMSAWNIEVRSTAREDARSTHLKSMGLVGAGYTKNVATAPDATSSGLYLLRTEHSATNTVHSHLTGKPIEIRYCYETLITPKRITEW